jgi:hypothetical protein
MEQALSCLQARERSACQFSSLLQETMKRDSARIRT